MKQNYIWFGIEAYQDKEGYVKHMKNNTNPIITIPTNATEIPEFAFYGYTGLTSITIPNNITKIGAYAFGGCTGLMDITIPSSITTIGDYAFASCKEFKKVIIPSNIKNMGKNVFSNCTNLKTAGVIGSDCDIEFGWDKNIPSNAFYGCNTLESIIIPEGFKSIGDYAFSKCSKITEFIIPSSVENIGKYILQYCNSLNILKVPYSCSLADDALDGFKNLKKFVFVPGTNDVIGKRGTRSLPWNTPNINSGNNSNSSIEEIEFSEGITLIGGFYCFSNSLRSIIFPKSLTSITGCIVYECPMIENIEIPENVINISYSSFSGCQNLNTIILNSESVVSAITKESYFESLKYINTIYIKSNIVTIGSYIMSNYTIDTTQDKEGYVKYVKNT